MENLIDLINGTLLGDACLPIDRGKYYRYKLTAKDRNFIIWFGKKLSKYNINFCITLDKRNNTNILYSSTNDIFCKKLRDIWYIEREGMNAQKIIPRDLELTPTTLLHWYLGDGSLNRHKNDNRVPAIVLATNCFSEEDIDFLILKLKELNLNFYKVRYKSGFTGRECGYCLYSRTQDGTPFRFFKLIGLECPNKIANCITGRKGFGSKLHYFRDKWPIEDEWIMILSNIHGIGQIIKEKRIEMKLSSAKLAELTNISSRFMRHIEFGDRFPGANNFRRIINILDLDGDILLNSL